MRQRAERRREQVVLAEYFGFTRTELLALSMRAYAVYRSVYVEQNKNDGEE